MAMNRVVGILFAVLFAVFAPAARADLYRYVDPGTGWFVYSNQRLDASGTRLDGGTRPQRIPPASSGRTVAEKSSWRRAAASPAVASPDDFPRVSATTQKARDSDRRKILSEELESEQAALGSAIEKSAAEDIIHRHKANIAALQRELANTR